MPVFDARNAAAPTQDIESRRQRVWLAAAGLAVLAVISVVAWVARDGVAVPADIQHSVAVLPLQMFTESGSRGHIADQVAEVLTTELAKNEQLRVLSRTTASKYRETTSSLPEIARALAVRWVVEGGVGVQGSRVYVKLRAIDALTDRKVWADVFEFFGSHARAWKSAKGQKPVIALVAYPEEYRSSGVMTFVVMKDGVIYEKDLGNDTTTLASTMTTFRKDPTWRPTGE